MDAYQELITTLALVMGVGWASGINLYAAVAVLGFSSITGNLDLPENLQVLENPLVIGAACVMYFIEFFVDKTPGLDTAWDSLHTFVRIPAGVMLAAGAVGEVSPALQIASGLLGGSMATGSHLAKTSSRVLINTSPEPFSNWGASISEDLMVFGGLWAMLNHPWLFVGLMVIFIAVVIWLVPKIWRLLGTIVNKIKAWLGDKTELPDQTLTDQPQVADKAE
jgi:hypothetical protein